MGRMGGRASEWRLASARAISARLTFSASERWMRSVMVCAGIGRTVPSGSKTAAITPPSGLICPRCISVLQVDRFVIRVELQGRGALLLGAEARTFCAPKRQLILHSGAGQVHSEQPRLHPLDVFEHAGDVAGL